MSRDGAPSDIFFTGGALPPDSLSYVKRPADDELFDSVLAGKLCCIFAPHHMGKSSLMLRTARQLEQRGIRTVTADLASSGGDSSVVQLFQYLTRRVQYQLDLPVDVVTWWWVEQAYSDPIQGLVNFLRGEVLSKDEGSIVIFLDGIDTPLDSDILDSLLTAIRQMYQARETDAAWCRLTFVLIGTNSLDDLIRNYSHFPFRACHNIDLREFSHEEAQVLQHGLRATCPDDAETTFSRIFYWTSGHPYLTQKLCMAVANAQDGDCTDEEVDRLVERVFLSPETGIEPNLQVAEDSIRMDKRRRQLLSCYRRVYKGKKVAEDEHSFAQHRLKLIGLLGGESGTLKVRNEVYRSAFDSAWIRATMPANWTLRIAAAGVLLILLLIGFANFSFSRQQHITEAQTYIDSFRNTSDSDERLISLAGLFKLGEHDADARHLFFEELSPADQLALFKVADPKAVAEQLVTVVKGVYTDPRLRNNEHSNAVLGAMAQPLTELEHLASLGAPGLELEIRMWLKGREFYSGDGQYEQAIHTYDIAINLNNRNPGTYFDRAEAYVAQGETNQAFADFAKVFRLDQRWQEPVQEALMSDPQLYTALSLVPGEYGELIALVPTQSNTSIPPTSTPSPTSMSPVFTSTDTSVPSTSSPTPTITATVTPTTEPTATREMGREKLTPEVTTTATPTAEPARTPTLRPTTAPTATYTPTTLTPTSTTSITASTPAAPLTPTVPSGTFTLLEPISLDDPTHGPTDFKWEWSGGVPPGFGFEVRVWRMGEAQVGAHDALLDNQNGNIQNIGGQEYHLNTNIEGAAGVEGRSGVYLWTVALVQVSPSYADLGQQAEPAQLRLEVLGASGDEDTGGGVGIE